jgi:NADPH2:quinone reductase
MVQAIRFAKTGGPEVLEWQQVEVGTPGPGPVRLQHPAAMATHLARRNRTGRPVGL